ncbi:hypothetical protein [Frankia sp. AgW1.1]|uniref:hypothetical protein n=1 Tax=Frankia sp. AgW1.1 TaxID=1836971 RepID=UPI001932CD95|nr:hypothetical protein [Frankia sp. AgW1.1]MBL7487147.1 hypothetical protein [Frankia sp. AgW1.1]
MSTVELAFGWAIAGALGLATVAELAFWIGRGRPTLKHRWAEPVAAVAYAALADAAAFRWMALTFAIETVLYAVLAAETQAGKRRQAGAR